MRSIAMNGSVPYGNRQKKGRIISQSTHSTFCNCFRRRSFYRDSIVIVDQKAPKFSVVVVKEDVTETDVAMNEAILEKDLDGWVKSSD